MGAFPTSRQGRESAFYEQEAAGLEAAALPPANPDKYDAPLLDALGPVDGLRVLELGCGRGDLSLELLRRGARLTALDISPGMVEVARQRARHFRPGAEARFAVAPAEDTGLPGGEFDRAVGKWVLHHTEVARAVGELHRVLARGGRASFFENQDRNPLLRAGRRVTWRLSALTRVGTADERPLGHTDLEVLARAFDQVERHYPSLYLFEALGRALGRGGLGRLGALDSGLWRRFPPLRPFGHHVLITFERR